MDPILEQFLSEARDNLDYLDSHLKDLADGDEETTNALFRAAHTLKGGAGLVGLTHIKEITHAAEDLLDAYRNGRVEYSDAMLDTLYDAFDEVIELVDAVEESGEVDIEVDEDRIGSIKRSVLSFLEGDGQKAETKEVTLPFALDENLSLPYLNEAQLRRILPYLASSVTIDETFVQASNPWVIDLNLSPDTIELGNDPFYLLSMLGNENLPAVSTCVYDPDDYSNPLQLKTRMKAVCLADVETIEEVFYNVIDEIVAAPLDAALLLRTDAPSLPNETFDTLLVELPGASEQEVQQKLKAALNVINPESREGFVVERLYEVSRIDFEAFGRLLGLLEPKTKSTDATSAEVPPAPSGGVALEEKERASTLNILATQKKALQAGGAFERVKFLLKNVAAFLGVEKSIIDAIEEEEALLAFIEKMEGELGGESEPEAPAQKVPSQPVSSETPAGKEAATPSDARKSDVKASPKKPTEARHAVPKTVKIDQEEIDALMDIVGEILVIKNALPYIAEGMTPQNCLAARRELLGKYEEISRITEQLQDRVMDMRLLPLAYIFNRYPKLVRDISKKLGKKIEYKEYGAETKLDKMMIEKLADPLVHIIRNSLDHGLESVEERVAAGKSETGLLEIGARSEGDRVFITVKDDGRGIDVDKVVQKALEKHLVDPDKIDTMSKEEKLGLIFLPGLSTKENITDLSGRGVGADAVKTTVEELGGKIFVRSERGRGTTVTLELPVSVALSNLFQIKMGGQNYAVAMDSVIETDKIPRTAIRTANHQPYIRLRESIVPVVLEERLLGREEFREEESVIIVRVNERRIALVADELVGQIAVVQKPLPTMLVSHPYINGTSLLGNGKPLFVIRPEALVRIDT